MPLHSHVYTPSNDRNLLFADDDDCFYYHSWCNNVVIAFGTVSSYLASHMNGVFCVVCPSAGDENLCMYICIYIYIYICRYIDICIYSHG